MKRDRFPDLAPPEDHMEPQLDSPVLAIVIIAAAFFFAGACLAAVNWLPVLIHN